MPVPVVNSAGCFTFGGVVFRSGSIPLEPSADGEQIDHVCTDIHAVVLDVVTAIRSVKEALLGDFTNEFGHVLATDTRLAYRGDFETEDVRDLCVPPLEFTSGEGAVQCLSDARGELRQLLVGIHTSAEMYVLSLHLRP